MAVVAMSAAALLALYVCFRPPPAEAPAPPPGGVSNAETPPRAEFALTVIGDKLVSGPDVIRVAQGTQVTIRIRSDRADELHLHGYDLHVRFGANQPAELAFTANRSGRFEYELHGSHAEIGALEVRPE